MKQFLGNLTPGQPHNSQPPVILGLLHNKFLVWPCSPSAHCKHLTFNLITNMYINQFNLWWVCTVNVIPHGHIHTYSSCSLTYLIWPKSILIFVFKCSKSLKLPAYGIHKACTGCTWTQYMYTMCTFTKVNQVSLYER